MKKKKKKKVKIRVPVAPPARRHKTKKDYKRNKKVIRELPDDEPGTWLYRHGEL